MLKQFMAMVMGLLGLLPVNLSLADADTAPVSSFSLPRGIDMHDGTVIKARGRYFAYGTAYRCGFRWARTSPWCGFRVSSASTRSGPWSKPTLLVSPKQRVGGMTLNALCAKKTRGKGCFNPRMVRRSDGSFLLWFNAVASWKSADTHAYWTMRCAGPKGPCRKPKQPNLHQCNGNNGDFTVTGGVLFCSIGARISQEKLGPRLANGIGVGTVQVGGLTNVEAPGVYRRGDGLWVLTYSNPNCGYCAGTGTGYATSTSILGPWTPQGVIDGTSCNGQPRTVTVLDGIPFQGIDQWTSVWSRNQTRAKVKYAPLPNDFSNNTSFNCN